MAKLSFIIEIVIYKQNVRPASFLRFSRTVYDLTFLYFALPKSVYFNSLFLVGYDPWCSAEANK